MSRRFSAYMQWQNTLQQNIILIALWTKLEVQNLCKLCFELTRPWLQHIKTYISPHVEGFCNWHTLTHFAPYTSLHAATHRDVWTTKAAFTLLRWAKRVHKRELRTRQFSRAHWRNISTLTKAKKIPARVHSLALTKSFPHFEILARERAPAHSFTQRAVASQSAPWADARFRAVLQT